MCLVGWFKAFLITLEEMAYFKEVIINQAKVQSGCIACYEVTPESRGYSTDNQNITLVA